MLLGCHLKERKKGRNEELKPEKDSARTTNKEVYRSITRKVKKLKIFSPAETGFDFMSNVISWIVIKVTVFRFSFLILCESCFCFACHFSFQKWVFHQVRFSHPVCFFSSSLLSMCRFCPFPFCMIVSSPHPILILCLSPQRQLRLSCSLLLR